MSRWVQSQEKVEQPCKDLTPPPSVAFKSLVEANPSGFNVAIKIGRLRSQPSLGRSDGSSSKARNALNLEYLTHPRNTFPSKLHLAKSVFLENMDVLVFHGVMAP